ADLRIVDWRRQRDSRPAGTQAENGSAGCAAYPAVADGESFSQDLGTEWGESGSAATAVASASHGAGAHADHEPAASGGVERRATLQEAAVAGRGTPATGVVSVSPLGEPATARSTGVAGSTDSEDCRTDASHRTGSGQVS